MTEPQGAHESLLEAVAVMDRLRSPGGCPWDAEQTHASLAKYLLEESHELIEAIDNLADPQSDRATARAHLREELGDVLLQVLFHARVAQDDPDAPFGIDDVAETLVEKLTRRHPHVFGDGSASTPEEVEAEWVRIKAQEKAARTSPLDGIPPSLPALARADKVISRLEKAGEGFAWQSYAAGDDIGARLLALVGEARSRGEDPEAALRDLLRRMERDRAAE